MHNKISTSTNHEFEIISNQLFANKEQQQELRQTEKELKSDVLSMMKSRNIHKGANGTIEKIRRKPKRIYDSDKLRAVLFKRGMPEEAVDEIIKQSTRRMNVDEHLSVKVKRSK